MQRNSSSDNDITLHTNNIKKIYEDHFTETSALRMNLILYAEFADDESKKSNYLDQLNQLFEQLDRDMHNIGPEITTSSRLETASSMNKAMGSFPELIKNILKGLEGNYPVEDDISINSIYAPINNIINEGRQLHLALTIKMQQENNQQKNPAQRRERSNVVTSTTSSLDRPGVAPPHIEQKSKISPGAGLAAKSSFFKKMEKDKKPKSAPTLPEGGDKKSPNSGRRK
ncbi:MAG TPA: hypothetical protein VL360_04060 [Gammaproteobacteria bacterium]|jgi:hypothetical protein|nr:hypothetical protein [Gammaproteobacteria bacterium]